MRFRDIIAEYSQVERQPETQTNIRSHGDILENPAFVRWFGDSKVRDSNGTPLVCYHGTFHDFTKFQYETRVSDKHVVSATGFNRLGFWFDVNPDTPSYFAGYHPDASHAGNIKPCFLRITNPFFLSSEYLFDEDRQAYVDALNAFKALQAKQREKYFDWGAYTSAERVLDKWTKELTQRRQDGFWRLMKLLPGGMRSTTKEVENFQQELIREGHDGIFIGDTIADWGSRGHKATDWWIAFHPEQIKSIYAKDFQDSPHIDEDA